MSEVRMTAKQVDELLAALRVEILTPGATVEWDQRAGCERREDWNTGYYETKPNGSRTFTVTVKVDGGARETTGEPIR